jgi:hypothetical protein
VVTRAHGFWLVGLLSSSCAIGGFSIVDELPGTGGSGSSSGGGGSSAGGTPSGGTSGSISQGGNGTSGSTTEGGRAGTAGSLGDAGSADAGGPGQGQAGAGEGGAPPVVGPSKPCDPTSDGAAPLFCDDFESGYTAVKWLAPAGTMPESGQGPHGPTKLAHLTGGELATTVKEFNLAAGEELTLSFWVKGGAQTTPGAAIASFRARNPATDVRLTQVQKELGWANSDTNFRVPEVATGAMFLPNEWTCVTIRFTDTTMVLSYQAQGAMLVNTLMTDGTATPGVDSSWQNQPQENRLIAGYPAFGGAVNGVPSEIYVDDVRIAKDKSSVCGF